jgi:hypothetical protein
MIKKLKAVKYGLGGFLYEQLHQEADYVLEGG